MQTCTTCVKHLQCDCQCEHVLQQFNEPLLLPVITAEHHGNISMLYRSAVLAGNMSTRYYALIAGGRRGIQGLAELYGNDSVSTDACVQKSYVCVKRVLLCNDHTGLVMCIV